MIAGLRPFRCYYGIICLFACTVQESQTQSIFTVFCFLMMELHALNQSSRLTNSSPWMGWSYRNMFPPTAGRRRERESGDILISADLIIHDGYHWPLSELDIWLLEPHTCRICALKSGKSNSRVDMMVERSGTWVPWKAKRSMFSRISGPLNPCWPCAFVLFQIFHDFQKSFSRRVIATTGRLAYLRTKEV